MTPPIDPAVGRWLDRRWPLHDHDTNPEAAVTVRGRQYRRYDGVWCGRTREGRWRSLDRVGGHLNVGVVLNELHALAPDTIAPAPILGQTEMELNV